MVANKRRRLIPYALCVALMILEVGVVNAESAEIIGRYTRLGPSESAGLNDLLAAPVIAPFESTVSTVAEAVGEVLRGTGVSLSPPSDALSERAALLALSLPATHRDLSGRPVRAALEILAGPAFKLVEDPAHRLVSFERCHAVVPPVTERVAPP